MDILSKQKTYIWVIVILVVINFVTLSFLWIGRPGVLPPPPRQNVDMGEFLTKELNLSKTQLEKFNKYREEHFEVTSQIIKAINEKKKEILNESFKKNPDKKKVNELAEEIGALNTKLEEFLFQHFTKLESVLTPDQQKQFYTLVQEAAKRDIAPPQNNNHLPPPRTNDR